MDTTTQDRKATVRGQTVELPRFDGQDHGHIFKYVPAKVGIGLIAGALAVVGICELISWVVFQYRHEGVIEPTPTGYRGHLSCAGMREDSAEARATVEISLCALCGFLGLFGVLDHCASKLNWFYCFFMFEIAFRFAFFVWDTLYTAECKAYPTNVMQLLVFWPVYNLPVLDRRKSHLINQIDFKYSDVNSYLGVNLYAIYVVFTVFTLALFLYMARAVRRLMCLYREGDAGMGEWIPMQLGDLTFAQRKKQLGQKLSAWEQQGKSLLEDHPLLKPANFSEKFSFGFNNELYV